MTDQNVFGEREAAVPQGWSASNVTATMTSIAEPVLSGDYGANSAPVAPPAPPASRLPWFAAVAGALILLIGGGFFALTAFGATGGADSPEEAVDAMIAAANDEDVIAMAELLEPSERRTIAEPMITEVLPELIRLGVLDGSADAADVSGFDVEFTDVTYRVEPVAGHADMVRVYFTGGQATGEFRSAEFPFGDEFRERFGDDMTDEPRTTEDIEPSETPLVLVERDGRWYMSAMFSIAEAGRIEEGAAMPALAAMPPALGSSSPEAAVEALIGEVVELDVAGMVGRIDPEEMAVLYRYSPLFLDDAQMAADEFQQSMAEGDVQWDVTEFDFDVETNGDDASVTIRGFRFELTGEDVDVSFTWARDRLAGTLDVADLGRGSFEATPTEWTIEGVVEGETIDVRVSIDRDQTLVAVSGEIAGETFTGQVDFDDDGACSRYSVSTGGGESEAGCLEDDFAGAGGLVAQQYLSFLENFPDEFTGPTIATRRTDGEWYVSPVTTVLDYYVDSLRDLDEGEFERMLDGLGAASMVGFGAIDSVDSGFVGDDAAAFDDGFTSDAMSQEEIDEFFESIDEGLGDDFDGFSTDAVLASSQALVLGPGESATLDGALVSGAFDELTIDLETGDALVVTVQATTEDGLDSTVEVFDSSGTSVGYNDDADSSAGLGLFDSRLEVEASSDGTHRIEIRSFGDFGEGGYTVTISRP